MAAYGKFVPGSMTLASAHKPLVELCTRHRDTGNSSIEHFGQSNVVEFECHRICLNVGTSILVGCKKPARLQMWSKLTTSILVGRTPGGLIWGICY